MQRKGTSEADYFWSSNWLPSVREWSMATEEKKEAKPDLSKRLPCLPPPARQERNGWRKKERDSANAVPTNRNYTTELSTFGIIAGVNPAEVQWSGLALGPPPTWSRWRPSSGKYELVRVPRDWSFFVLCPTFVVFAPLTKDGAWSSFSLIS